MDAGVKHESQLLANAVANDALQHIMASLRPVNPELQTGIQWMAPGTD